MTMVALNGSGEGYSAPKEKSGWLWRRKARLAKKNEPEEQVEFEEQVLDALDKLAKSHEDVVKRLGKLEQKISDFNTTMKEYRIEEIDSMQKEMQRRTLYMEGVFEEMLSNNWTKAGRGNNSRDRTTMYDKETGKVAGPKGKLP